MREPSGELSIWDKCSLISQLLPKISASLLGQEQVMVQPGKVNNPSARKKHKKKKCKDEENGKGDYTRIPDHLVADLCPPNGTGDVHSLISHFGPSFDDNPDVQAEATYHLACYFSGPDNSVDINFVVTQGVVLNAVRLLRWSPTANVIVTEQVLWLLVNLTGDSLALRDVVLEDGVLSPLATLLFIQRPNVKIMRPATLVLFNLISYKPQPPLQKMRPAIHALLQIVESSDDEVILTHTCWAIEHLCDDSDDKFQRLIQADVTSKLAKLFTFPSSTVQLSALRTVGCIVKKMSCQGQPIIDSHLLALFTPFLTEKHKKKVKAKVCRIISDIPGGNVEHVQALIDSGIAVALIGIFLKKGLEIQVKTVRAIGNATLGANSDQIKFLMEHKYIDVLCGLLGGGDPKIIYLCIGLAENILKAADTPEESNLYAQKMRDVGKTLRDLSNLSFEEKISSALINITGVWDGIL